MSTVPFFTPTLSENRPYLSFADQFLSYSRTKGIANPYKPNEVKIIENDESKAYIPARILALLATGYAIFQIAQSPRQILKNHKLHLIPLAAMTALFLAKVYYRATTNFHVCPPKDKTKLPADLIDDTVRKPLDALTAAIATTDKIPTFPGDTPPKFDQMTAPIMKGIFAAQGGTKPYIAIKIRTQDHAKEGMIVLTTTDPEHLTDWYQFSSSNVSQFFDRQFIEKGCVTSNCEKAYSSLQQFIVTGHCTWEEGIDWEIPGHPKLITDKIAEPIKTLLNELLGDKGPVDRLPVLEKFQDELPSPEEVTAPIMMYLDPANRTPTLVFKLQSCDTVNGDRTGLLILAQDAKNDRKWRVQRNLSSATPTFFEHGLTNENGELDTRAKKDFGKLKELILNGKGEDLRNPVNRMWKLVTE